MDHNHLTPKDIERLIQEAGVVATKASGMRPSPTKLKTAKEAKRNELAWRVLNQIARDGNSESRALASAVLKPIF
jgi:hypothetical protein